MHEKVREVVTQSLVCDLLLSHLDNDNQLNYDKDKQRRSPECPINCDPFIPLFEQLAGHFDEKVHHKEESKRATSFLKCLQEDASDLCGEGIVAEDD